MQHLGNVGDDIVQIKVARLQGLPPAEHEKLTGKVGPTLGGLLDLFGEVGLHGSDVMFLP